MAQETPAPARAAGVMPLPYASAPPAAPTAVLPDKATARAEGLRLQAALLAAAGHDVEAVDAPVLLPAGTLLDLYGEDIRARAYVTTDPVQGEMMLRPDFTVPVVEAHMAGRADPARYTYLGEVFRKQDRPGSRASEYLQLGYEVFARDDPAACDAEVFALFSEVLAPLALHARTGDFGILIAVVNGLATTDRRKAALMRHLWRPTRFRALLDRFGGLAERAPARADLVAALRDGRTPVAAGPWQGLRTEAEMQDRFAALLEDAAAPAIAAEEVALVVKVLDLAGKSPAALAEVQALAQDFPALHAPADRMAARLDALAARSVDVADLDFAASYGRTTLEYYDGFVFGLYADAHEDLPAIASGGRYDALTTRFGRGGSIPAVGGVIRPGLVAALTAPDLPAPDLPETKPWR